LFGQGGGFLWRVVMLRWRIAVGWRIKKETVFWREAKIQKGQ
jgi:hypothetical protein